MILNEPELAAVREWCKLLASSSLDFEYGADAAFFHQFVSTWWMFRRGRFPESLRDEIAGIARESVNLPPDKLDRFVRGRMDQGDMILDFLTTMQCRGLFHQLPEVSPQDLFSLGYRVRKEAMADAHFQGEDALFNQIAEGERTLIDTDTEVAQMSSWLREQLTRFPQSLSELRRRERLAAQLMLKLNQPPP